MNRRSAMEEKSYFERIEEKIMAQEKILGRKLTIDEQDDMKFLAMQELWVDTGRAVAEEKHLFPSPRSDKER